MEAEEFFRLGVSKFGETLKKLPRDNFQTYGTVKIMEASPPWKMVVKDEGKTDEVQLRTKTKQYNQFLTMAITKERYNGRMKAYEKNSARKYKIFTTRIAVEKFVANIPPYRRHLEEMIFPDTPHRFYLDIERDLPGCSQADLDEMLRYLIDNFLEILTVFFNDRFGIDCTENDWRVCVASQVGVKFSTHVTLFGNFYCGTRICSWAIAGLLAQYLDGITDPEFINWYNVSPANARRSEKVVDFHVYHSGLRNMRFLGCIKLHGKLGIHWETMRPFKPIESQKKLPWTDFLCTVNHAPRDPNFIRLIVKQEWLPSLNEFINMQFGEMTAISTDFKNLMSALNADQNNHNFVSFSNTTRRNSSGSPGDAFNVDSTLPRILKMINALGDFQTITGHNYTNRMERCEEQRELKKKFFLVAKKLGLRMLNLLHPGNHGTEQQANADKGEIFKIRFTTIVKTNGRTLMRTNEQGERKEQRLCFFSFDEKLDFKPCERGTHAAELVVMSDFSVEYFCHGCKSEREVILDSPIEKFTVRPKLYDCKPTEFPENIDYINYSENNDYETDVSPFMRNIKRMESGVHWDKDVKRTVMLHGGMGTGKSTACKEYLRRTDTTIRNQTGRAPRILSITFRMMLARSNSKTFDLVAYNDEDVPSELFEFDRVACQLDSICRLGKVEENIFVLKDPYDIVLLDESESILSHLSSDTMQKKRAEVFEVFRRLIMRANTVIVADADMARRTHHFISTVRPVTENSVLEYHRNPFVRKDMQYLDYKYMNSWLSELTEAVLGPSLKRVFIVSNNKAKLKTIQRYIHQELSKRVKSLSKKRLTGQRLSHFNRLKGFLEDPKFSRVIDAENNGADKKRMAEECDEMWSEYRVLGITPVVGAGISFDKPDHFNEAYIFATPSSCCPRAINQLLGRVRHLSENRVRLFIDDSIAKSAAVEDEDGIYRKIKRQALNVKSVKLDRMSVKFDPDTGTMAYCLQTDDDLLVRMHAMNEEEAIKGKSDFRCELIRVLQRNNPALNYRFNTRGAFTSDTSALLRFDEIKNVIQDEELLAVSVQPEEQDQQELGRVKRNNDKGAVVYLEDEERQENVVKIIDKSEVAQQLAMQEETTEDIYEAYITFLETLPDGLETVENAARYLFASTFALKQSQAKLLQETRYQMEGEQREYVIREKVSQGLDNLFYRRKYWLRKLLFIGGFTENDGPEDESPELFHELVGHSKLQRENLDTEEHQKWLKKHVPAILDDLKTTMEKGVVKMKDPLPEGERQRKPDDYVGKNVTWLTKAYLRKYTGISTSSSEKQDPDGPQEKPKRIKCPVHGSRCYLQKSDESDFRVLLSLVHQWLLQKGESEDPWIQEAQVNCLKVCQELNIGVLPGMRPLCEDLGHEELDEDSFFVFCRQMIETQRKSKTQQLKTKRTKKRKRSEEEEETETPEQKFENRWNKILDVHVGPDMYQQKDAMIYLNNLLSEGYKFRTKKQMLRCKAAMLEKLKKLGVGKES